MTSNAYRVSALVNGRFLELAGARAAAALSQSPSRQARWRPVSHPSRRQVDGWQATMAAIDDGEWIVINDG